MPGDGARVLLRRQRPPWARLLSVRADGEPGRSQAKRFEDFMRRPSAGLAIRALRQETDPDRAWAVYQRVLGTRYDMTSLPFFQSVMSFCRHHLPSKAPTVLQAAVARRHRVDQTLFLTLLAACQHADPPMIGDALESFAKWGPKTHDVLFAVAHTCRVANQPSSALFLVADAVDRDVPISEPLLSIFAACCAEAKSPAAADTAERLLDLIRSGRVHPHRNERVYANLVKAILAQNRFSPAVNAIHWMHAIGMSPSAHVYTLALSALAKNDRLLDALALFHQMVERYVDVDAPVFSQVVAACGRTGTPADVRALYRYAFERGVLGDDFIVCAFVYAYDHCGDLGAAEHVFRERSEQATPNLQAFNAMIAAYAHHGMLERAIHTFERLKSSGLPLDEHVYTNALSVYAKADRTDDAMALYQTMVDEGVAVDAPAFACLVAACGRCSDRISIYRLHRYAHEARLLDDDTVVCAFVSVYDLFGELRLAEQVFHERAMTALPDVVTCNALIVAYSRHGHLAKAMDTFMMVKKSGQHLIVEVLANMLCVYAKADRFSHALAMFHAMVDQGVQVGGTLMAGLVRAAGRSLQPSAVVNLQRCSDEMNVSDDPAVASAFVYAYVLVGDLENADLVFRSLR
ncbi:hypothetical protein PBRA_005810 [Plasmodiophora brassicae]|uniref:PROP1-like PPR domain-containing protein n=1 Tax=Plasmodiophora brassicae TaxID=37360 RepID=A0A0G4IRH7_PLABS|nr:hypothetical protein PBRA_005810 [Plasmodiophora brassicae]